MIETRRSYCRICTNQCGIKVVVENGRAVEVKGDSENPLFKGFTCIKGRAQPEYLAHPDRVLCPLKRTADGFKAIPLAQAIDEIAEKLVKIIAQHGPRTVASWAGTMQVATAGTAQPFLMGLMEVIGSPFTFDPNTIDKGGKQVAASMLGQWMAPPYGFNNPEAILLIGINPMVTCTGLPAGNPGQWLKEATRKGTKLIVIDPRVSDIAERAHLHLRPTPGHDAEILAGMLRIILAENLHDRDFVAEHVSGVEELQAALAPFTPERVSTAAGISPDDLKSAARIYAGARRGYTMAGTGPHMSGPGSLVEYLILTLETLCGNWMREGERPIATPTLLAPVEYRAQAKSPAPQWAMKEKFVRGLSQTAAGLPSGALIDHMLLEDERRIRALISYAGNPAAAFPDTLKTMDALGALDLLVQIDPWMSATSHVAHYIIAPTMPLEAPGATIQMDRATGRATGYGLGVSYAQYSPAIATPPAGSEVIDDWKFFYRLGKRMGVPVFTRRLDGTKLEFETEPTTDELLDAICVGSRVPFATIKAKAAGDLYPDLDVVVLPKEPGASGRLHVGAKDMMRDLANVAAQGMARGKGDHKHPLRLVCRRYRHVYNSSCNVPGTNKGKPFNPAFMHPDDLAKFGVTSGETAELHSDRGSIRVIVEADDAVLPGLVSMVFAFGNGAQHDVAKVGSNVNLLVSNDEVFDRYTGQPRMSNVPVTLRKISA